MATQTVEFLCVTGQTITAKLFSVANDTQVASASATEATNRKGTYSAAYTDVAAGTYRLIALNASNVPLASWWVTLTLTTATFQAYEIPYDALDATLDGIADDITAYIASISAVAQATTGTIVGFPTSLNIGDSYTDDCDASIHVFIRDDNNDPITEVGDHAFTDPDFAPELIITAGGNNGRVKATVTYVDASPAESYLKVQLPRVETLKAGPGTATMQCRLKWDGAQKTIAKQAVTWVSQI